MSDWRASAGCRGKDTSVFFEENNLNILRARVICSECPVIEECFNYATDPLTIEEVPEGIFAGFTGRQRWNIAGGWWANDWRARFREHRTCRTCGDVMVWERPYFRCRTCGPPAIEKKRLPPAEKERRYRERLERKQSPECPQCGTKEAVERYRRNAKGEVVWVHLPCRTKIVEEAAA